jgi:hypothetical protein
MTGRGTCGVPVNLVSTGFDIEGAADCVAALSPNLGHHFLKRSHPAASENDGRSLPCQEDGSFPTDASSCADNEYYFPVDQAHYFSYSAAAGVEQIWR